MEEPVRKRMRRREEKGGVRFLTFSCYRRMPLFANDSIKDAFVEELGRARERHGFRLIAYVVMPEHVHLIIVVGRSPVRAIMWGLKKPFAQRVIGRWEALGWRGLDGLRGGDGRPRFWQAGGGFDRNVRDEEELNREVAYIHHNPVRRGLAPRPTDWAWSSARWYARGGPGDGEDAVEVLLEMDPTVRGAGGGERE